VPLTRHCLIGVPRKNLLLRAADEGTYEKSRARNIPRPECLYDVAASMRSALGELPVHTCNCATELDLKCNLCQCPMSAEFPDCSAIAS
jgi:hypothetical protein